MNQIFIASRRKKIDTLKREFPNAEIIDVTSKAEYPWVKFSPFYPHGNIPIPFSNGEYAYSVEGIWQGLKVFETTDIDKNKFGIQNMKNIKRTVRKNGSVLGHRKGTNGTELLHYVDARKSIYIPAYSHVLSCNLTTEIETLISKLNTKEVVLLDYETNDDIEDTKKPLSHASLIKSHIHNLMHG